MELKLDVKTLLIGIAIGIAVTAAIGANGSADKADFGIAIPSNTGEGAALVRTADDGLYVVSLRSGMAIRVLQAPVKTEPSARRSGNYRPFFLSVPSQTTRSSR